ncbi:Permease of the drug/metabolite transporter (DMT) superfamily [Chitinophaga jiangningensis]|uniref:Permease of the drug/metabolite transporter (DMT) superfamily n=1 Tax=Chitinophaga jiangningensis TaxID=1419482 RepID=A0A1M7AHA2_9BACT|nr:EamA family transporter [Chitinophaga jiangningensis]SHL41995.1 Permease of the drug/metabolite transporter (DMT) superfamily [Chitinophaga jiangningensis]
MTSDKPVTTQTFVYLLAVYIIWGSTYLGMKVATETVPAFFLSSVRFFLAGLLLLAIGGLKEKTLPNREQLRNAIFVGTLLIGIGNTTVAVAVHYMPSGLVALLVAAMPAWFMVLDWAFFSRNKPGTLTLLGIAVGFIGLFLLFNPFGNQHVESFPLWPVLIVIFGNICWAIGSLLVQRFSMPTQITSTAIQMLAGAVFALVVSLIAEHDQVQQFLGMSHRGWFAYLYLVLIGSLVGYTSYSWLARNAPPRLTSTYAYINPVVALLLGWAIGHESITPMVAIASAIVVGGVVLMTLGKK